MVMGLNTGLWVMAQVRICDRAFIPATVVRRGDPDAGTVLLKLNRFEAGVTVYARASTRWTARSSARRKHRHRVDGLGTAAADLEVQPGTGHTAARAGAGNGG